MSRGLKKIILLYLVLILSLILINLKISSPVISGIRAFLALSLATFLPGYLFTLFFLGKNAETSERLVISISLSISLVILLGVLIHLLGIRISVQNILNPLWFIVSISVIGLLFVKRNKKSKKRIELDGFFYLNLSMILVFFLILIFISMNLPSGEGFVELYWDFVKVENPWVEPSPVCEIDYSLSDFNRVQRARIGNEKYNILFLDINQPGKYDSICVDLNHNEIYCEDDEGPFWSPLGFRIGPEHYSYTLIENGVVIYRFPTKLVNQTNFNVYYNIKSHYPEIEEFEIIISVNGDIISREKMFLDPGESRLVQEQIVVPEIIGKHEVEIAVLPQASKERVRINFFTEFAREF
ncbi:MAG: hypothetical protein GF368_02970 [Candidatus Aenigmarchaeota archaeon]|nr:hypothetical protein [Candidatus Aenigmarchaeota archaeon]